MPYWKQNSLGNGSNVIQTVLLRLEEGWSIVLGEELIDELKTAILWNVTPYNFVDTNQRFVGTCCLLLHINYTSRLNEKEKITVAPRGI
jgi:hypothetical protein